jgi:AraC-like DNA-binding protein
MVSLPPPAKVRGRSAGPTVQAWVLPHVIAWVRSRDIDIQPILSLPGLGPLDDPDARIPEKTAEAVWRMAADLTGDPALGIRVAESMPRGALDLVEYAFRSSASLALGLERLARYGPVMSDRVAARMEATGDGILMLVRDTARTVLHPGRSEFALAIALKLARDATGADLVPTQVCFAHPEPHDSGPHHRFFRGDIRFNAGANSMMLSAADGKRPLVGADAALATIVRRRLDKVLADREVTSSGSLGSQVRRMLVEGLGHATVTPDTAAAALHMSRRTLSRRLAEEKTSFRELLDEVRSEFARALLMDRSLSVADVAFFLNYSEPAAFHRSFRRWTGQTPSEYRAR